MAFPSISLTSFDTVAMYSVEGSRAFVGFKIILPPSSLTVASMFDSDSFSFKVKPNGTHNSEYREAKKERGSIW